jgi:hypothetical protein
MRKPDNRPILSKSTAVHMIITYIRLSQFHWIFLSTRIWLIVICSIYKFIMKLRKACHFYLQFWLWDYSQGRRDSDIQNIPGTYCSVLNGNFLFHHGLFKWLNVHDEQFNRSQVLGFCVVEKLQNAYALWWECITFSRKTWRVQIFWITYSWMEGWYWN